MLTTGIAPPLKGWDTGQIKIDNADRADGTTNQNLGANAPRFSLAVALRRLSRKMFRCFVISAGLRRVLPVPMMNILNGSAHSDAPIDFRNS
jgi:enolase